MFSPDKNAWQKTLFLDISPTSHSFPPDFSPTCGHPDFVQRGTASTRPRRAHPDALDTSRNVFRLEGVERGPRVLSDRVVVTAAPAPPSPSRPPPLFPACPHRVVVAVLVVVAPEPPHRVPKWVILSRPIPKPPVPVAPRLREPHPWWNAPGGKSGKHGQAGDIGTDMAAMASSSPVSHRGPDILIIPINTINMTGPSAPAASL